MDENHSDWGARKYIFLGLFTVSLLAGGLGTWSAMAKLSGAVIASGQLRVETQKQVVQHPEGGVVGAIHVRNGDVVKAGDILIQLDGNRLRSELAVLETQLFEMMARRGRLTAEQNNSTVIVFDDELYEVANTRPAVERLMEGQHSLFMARRETLVRELEILTERQKQFREQIGGTEGESSALDVQKELVEHELDDQTDLLAKGLTRMSRVMGLKREAARLAGEGGMMRAQTAQLKAQISELEIQKIRVVADARRDVISELRDVGFRELELRERRISLIDQLAKLDIRAPRSGVIYDMSVFALQSVVQGAEPLLYVVPDNEKLVVDARVDPSNIDQLYGGQITALRFSGLNQRTTPELAGTITRLSADVLGDVQNGTAYYGVEILIDQSELDRLSDETKLVPGMPVEAFIQTSSRTPMEYLMQPVMDYFSHALKED